MESDNDTPLQEFVHLYIGILNYYDLIASKLFRGTTVDFDDCMMLAKAKVAEMDLAYLKEHYLKLVRYDISEDRVVKNIEYSFDLLKEEGGWLKTSFSKK